MKKLLFILSILIYYTVKLYSQCPDSLYLTTQSQIDSFQINYPNCTDIEGNVTINGDDIRNLEGLNVITGIDGSLIISDQNSWHGNPQLINLYGLDNLSTIGGDLWIVGNDTLASLEGLESLVHIGGRLIIGGHIQIGSIYNPYLMNLSGLSGLSFIGGGITIKYNMSLLSLIGMESITTIKGIIYINSNPSLISLSGLEEITSIGGLFLSGNNVLTNLSGLEGLITINGNLEIWENNSLTSLSGLEELTSIDGNFSLGDWYIGASASPITSLDGLETLSTIGESLEISLNNTLTSLAGLDNLTSIGDDLRILQNTALTSLTGLEYIEESSIENLYVKFNPLLSQCEVESICDYLAVPNGESDIDENGIGCNSPEEVLDSCEAHAGIVDLSFVKEISIYPNPAHAALTIELPTQPSKNTTLTISNTNGQQLITQPIKKPQTLVDVSGLLSGVYFVKVVDDEKVMMGKVVKE